MLPLSVVGYIRSCDNLFIETEAASRDASFKVMNALSNQCAIKCAGLIENGSIDILYQYVEQRGNRKISRYTKKTLASNNSLNCNKIEKILNQFDTQWWPEIVESLGQKVLDDINSVKTIRDQIAHGSDNGTGLSTVKQYYSSSKAYVNSLASVVLS